MFHGAGVTALLLDGPIRKITKLWLFQVDPEKVASTMGSEAAALLRADMPASDYFEVIIPIKSDKCCGSESALVFTSLYFTLTCCVVR